MRENVFIHTLPTQQTHILLVLVPIQSIEGTVYVVKQISWSYFYVLDRSIYLNIHFLVFIFENYEHRYIYLYAHKTYFIYV